MKVLWSQINLRLNSSSTLYLFCSLGQAYYHLCVPLKWRYYLPHWAVVRSKSHMYVEAWHSTCLRESL